MQELSPVLFIGHGNPMNAIVPNGFRTAWQDMARTLPRPQAILCVSAHWETQYPQVCTADPPATIHDFYGFPPELFAQRYAAPGAPQLLGAVQACVGDGEVSASLQWGLDHGAWCVLQALFPEADIPVAQLSLARSFAPARHFSFARQLASLRRQGVLVLCSGNIVHNLGRMRQAGPYDWAQRFDARVARALEQEDPDALVDYARAGDDAALAVPTPEHYLPLLYAAALRQPGDRLSFFAEGFDLAAISMRSLQLRGAAA